jgi:hypothetical protein
MGKTKYLGAFEWSMTVSRTATLLGFHLQVNRVYQEWSTTQTTFSQLDTTVESIGVTICQHPCGTLSTPCRVHAQRIEAVLRGKGGATQYQEGVPIVLFTQCVSGCMGDGDDHLGCMGDSCDHLCFMGDSGDHLGCVGDSDYHLGCMGDSGDYLGCMGDSGDHLGCMGDSGDHLGYMGDSGDHLGCMGDSGDHFGKGHLRIN